MTLTEVAAIFIASCALLATWGAWKQRRDRRLINEMTSGRRREAWPQHPACVPGLPDDGDPLDGWELTEFTGIGLASMVAFRGFPDPDMACVACLDGLCAACDGEAVASGPCQCPHSAVAPQIGGGQ